MRRLLLLPVLLALLAPLGGAKPVAAQDARCFPTVAGVFSCIEGRFREYWEQNGGVPIFGYPLTAAHYEQSEGQQYLVQYFERARFELHPEADAPYDVLLGRLGVQMLDFNNGKPGVTEQQKQGCLWFAQTGHNVCDQENGVGFKTYWTTHGLLDQQLDAYGRSLALFGLPITAARTETNSSGVTVLTQWFERGRFEYVPANTPPYRVLLGLLGNEYVAAFPPAQGVITTGIDGKVLLGPTCGGPVRPGDCPNRPYEADISILDASRNPVTQVRSDVQGYFQVALPPGDYILVPLSPGKLPRAGEENVTVVQGQVTHVVITYDSGIR